MNPMKTIWSDTVGEKPLQEYPRPQFQRDSYHNLNGIWMCCFSQEESLPTTFDTPILVPFSPESLLSRVNRVLQPGEYLFYRREFTLSDKEREGRVLLHFGAVDQICTVYVNRKEVVQNRGGYYPFEADITDVMKEENELIVKVQDFSNTNGMEFGKQKLNRGGIWYTPQSGIWQTVWLECVPEDYLKSVKITPDLPNRAIHFAFDKSNADIPVQMEISFASQLLSAHTATDKEIVIPLSDVREWSPEKPDLYDVKFTYGSDTVTSYFAMRSISVETAKDGKRRICLNGRPYFLNGLLDQGYWSDGLYTAPSEEAMVFDILECKRLGYNTLRKHIKVEPLRWYYLCDKYGMLVLQDMVNGGTDYSTWYSVAFQLVRGPIKDDKAHRKGFGREDEEIQKEFAVSLERMIRHLYNSPCIVLWTIFNEGWGQFDSANFYQIVKKMDPTRLIDHASGWHDQGSGDIDSHHNYFRKQKVTPDKRGNSRPYVITEFGGYALKLKEHSFNLKQTFGYKAIRNEEDLNNQVHRLYFEQILPCVRDGLAGAIYTQVSDVEDEVNGLFTFDRKVIKFREETVSSVYKEIEKIYQDL